MIQNQVGISWPTAITGENETAGQRRISHTLEIFRSSILQKLRPEMINRIKLLDIATSRATQAVSLILLNLPIISSSCLRCPRMKKEAKTSRWSSLVTFDPPPWNAEASMMNPSPLSISAKIHYRNSNGRLALHITAIIPFIDLLVMTVTDIVISVQRLRVAARTHSYGGGHKAWIMTSISNPPSRSSCA